MAIMSASSKHRGLGRGLDALIQGGGARSAPAAAKKPAAKTSAKSSPAPAKPKAAAPAVETAAKGAPVKWIAVERITRNPWQPRREFAEAALQELADSIKAKGILQPVLVRQSADGFELIAGERRFRAAQMAGLKELPALLQEATDLDVMELALIENIQRADLNLIEEAEGYRLLLQSGLTQEDISKRVGKARAMIANVLRLLDLSDPIKQALAEGTLSAGHAKVLLGVDEGIRNTLAARVISQGLSVRALEKLIEGLKKAKELVQKRPPAPAPTGNEAAARHLKFLADRMQQELGTKVQLSPARVMADGKREMGRIVIEFFDNEDLSRLLDTLNLGDLT